MWLAGRIPYAKGVVAYETSFLVAVLIPLFVDRASLLSFIAIPFILGLSACYFVGMCRLTGVIRRVSGAPKRTANLPVPPPPEFETRVVVYLEGGSPPAPAPPPLQLRTCWCLRAAHPPHSPLARGATSADQVASKYTKVLRDIRFAAFRVVTMLAVLLVPSNVSGWTSLHWRDYCPPHLVATTVPLHIVFNQISIALVMGIASSAFISMHASVNTFVQCISSALPPKSRARGDVSGMIRVPAAQAE